MIAVDTNLLVYAHRADARFHTASTMVLARLAEERSAWAIPWPCLHEFVCVVTHPRIFRPPSTLAQGLGQVDAWRESPSLTVLGEPADYWGALAAAVTAAHATGPLVYDARIATICQLHGVRELWTADHDFSRFPGIAVWNPLVADAAHETAPAYRAARRAADSAGDRARDRMHRTRSRVDRR